MNDKITPLAGFRPFLRKELFEWWKRRAALATFAAVGAFGIIGTLDTRIEEWVEGGTPAAAALDPTVNVLTAQFENWVAFAAIFASIGILIQERSTGTLAWTLSKPVSRNAMLLAKWTGGVVMLTIFAILLPLAISVGVATIAYGSVPDLVAVAKLGGLLVALPAFFVALNLALATRLNSQAAIAAIGIGILAVPLFFGGFLPIIADVWPTQMAPLAVAMAGGEAAHLSIIASWAAVVLVLGAGGLLVFSREDM